jgi:hypothetical protein
MEKLLSEFKIKHLLRCFFGGMFFIISFNIYTFQTSLIADLTAKANSILIAVVVGVPVYAIHRALLYRPFEDFVTYLFDKRPYASRCISEKTVDYLVKVWRLDKDDKNSLYKKTDEWGDYTHLLYSVGWNIIIGLIYGIIKRHILDDRESPAEFFFGIINNINQPKLSTVFLFLLFLLFLVSGLISDLRLRSVREKILTMY